MAPLTGAAVSCGQVLVQREKGEAELALAKARQNHDFRMAYFEKAILGPKEQRLLVLRFLEQAYADPELRLWAGQELALEAGHTDAASRQRVLRSIESCANAQFASAKDGAWPDSLLEKKLRDCFEGTQRLKRPATLDDEEAALADEDDGSPDEESNGGP